MRCLIAIDDKSLSNTVQEYLIKIDNFNYIKIANTLQTAKSYLEEYDFDFMVASCCKDQDINHNLIGWIRAKNINIEVIFATEYKQLKNIQHAFRHGVCDYLILPLNFERFSLAVKRVIEKILFLHSQKQFTQKEIDDYIAISALTHIAKPVTSKGISTSTLEKIHASLENASKYFNADEIAQKTKLSRITVRRYLESMVDNKELKTFFEYGKIGRPHKLYSKLSNEDKND